mgnify:CR=1 FL=1
MHFLLGRLRPQRAVCCYAVVLDLAIFDSLLTELKGRLHSIEEYVVCVIGTLRFVRILQV